MTFAKKMLQNIFKPRWTPCVVTHIEGQYDSASVLIGNLECEMNVRSGKLRFKGDYGSHLHAWLSMKWKEQGDSPQKMFDGSPWNWLVDIPGFMQTTLKIAYAADHSGNGLYSDTLDAIISALENHQANKTLVATGDNAPN